jgi:DMSO reductase anchor subunit
MNIQILSLLFDIGLLVLIWNVQLIIYPGFQYYTPENLLKWHKKYTIGISVIVIPLMFGQLIINIIEFINAQTFHSTGSLILITLVWISTFTQFVPLHRKISQDQFDENLLQQLVKRNWIRTFLWTIICIWSLYKI